MHFNLKASFVLAAFVVLLVMALNESSWGTAANVAAIAIDGLLYIGIFGSGRRKPRIHLRAA